MYVSVKISP